MKLRGIVLDGFRILEIKSVLFTPGVNIITSKDSQLKKTFMDAIKMAISFFFSSDKKLGNNLLSTDSHSLEILPFEERDFIWPDVRIITEAQYGHNSFTWVLCKHFNSKNCLADIATNKHAFKAFTYEWKNNNEDLPLIVYISPFFPYCDLPNLAVNDILNKYSRRRNFGYYEWDNEYADIYIWECMSCNLLNSTNVNYANARKKAEYIQNYLIKASQILSEYTGEQYVIDYLTTGDKEYRLHFTFKDGKVKTFNTLPIVYARTYSIVLSLACRTLVLNGLKEPQGIVLIDNVNSLLGRDEERAFILCLKEMFPKVQFIMTLDTDECSDCLDLDERIQDPLMPHTTCQLSNVIHE